MLESKQPATFAFAAAPSFLKHAEAVAGQVGDFGDDNRAGIDRTLHRISCIRNRDGAIVGLTCRVGRAVTGCASLAADLAMAGKSILILGKPGALSLQTLKQSKTRSSSA